MRKVLVSGATGFLGAYVIPELLRRGVHVVATSSSIEKACKCDWFAKVDYRPLDLSLLDDEVDYFQYFGRPDLMIHLAWEGLPNYKMPFHIETNLPRHELFLSNLIKNGLKQLTVSGTCLEYGMKEGCQEESMVAQPVVAYAIAKDKLRRYLEPLCKAYEVQFIWLRLFYAYGEGQNENSLYSQLVKAIETGQKFFNMSMGAQKRDFMPIHMMSKYIVALAMQNGLAGIINVCSGRPVTVMEFVQYVISSRHATLTLNPGHYPYTDYEPMEFWGDLNKLKIGLANEHEPI